MLTDQSVPMCRLTERMVRSTLVTACRLATSPTSTSAFLAKATTEGVVREPSALAMTVGSPPSRMATTELVVPRSIPTARAMRSPCVCVKLSSSGSSLRGERAAQAAEVVGPGCGPRRDVLGFHHLDPDDHRSVRGPVLPDVRDPGHRALGRYRLP